MWHYLLQQSPAISAATPRATGGQSRQDLQMRHLPILYAAQNAATHGEVPTSMGFPKKQYFLTGILLFLIDFRYFDFIFVF